MKTPYSNSRCLAITAGVAATGGAIGLLVSDAVSTGHWTLDHAMTPLIVGLTVASGHLVANAARARKPLAAIGFAVAFMIGTGVTVLNGVGRQTEGAETKAAETTKANTAIADKQAELGRARQRYEQASTMAEREMTGQKCAQRCNDWKTRASEVSSHIAILEVQLKALGAVKPINAKASKVGELAAVFGFDGDRAKAGVTLLEPMLIPFLLEWVAITALGFGFGHGNHRPATVANADKQRATVAATVAETPATTVAPAATVAEKPEPTPPKPGNRRPAHPVAVHRVATKAAAEADVIQLIGRGQPLPSQDVLAMRWGCHKGTVSKWLADFERRGIVSRHADGRRKIVAAA